MLNLLPLFQKKLFCFSFELQIQRTATCWTQQRYTRPSAKNYNDLTSKREADVLSAGENIKKLQAVS